MQSQMNFNDDPAFDSLPSLSALDTALLPRHRWYHFKEAFSPDVVNFAIKTNALKKDATVIDPFSGSGTVVLSSSSKGLRGRGLEVNPFLAFVGQTKMLHTRPKTLDKHLSDVFKGIDEGMISKLEGFSTFTESSGGEKWLFEVDVLRAFEGGWQQTIGKQKEVRDLFRLALIGAALDACNAYKDGKCLRYRKNWEIQKQTKNEFMQYFQERIKLIRMDLEELPLPHIDGTIIAGDARLRLPLEIDEKFQLCVMSPPYLNSFDYTDVYRPELFLGKFIANNRQLQQLRLQTVRSHVQIKWNLPIESDFGINFTQVFDSIKNQSTSLWNSRIPQMIQAYFEDMKKVLSNLRSSASKNAQVWIVVSTSAYGGVEIPVDLILAEIATKVGWSILDISTVRHLRRVPGQQWDKLSEAAKSKKEKNNSPHLRESIVILSEHPSKSKRIPEIRFP